MTISPLMNWVVEFPIDGGGGEILQTVEKESVDDRIRFITTCIKQNTPANDGSPIWKIISTAFIDSRFIYNENSDIFCVEHSSGMVLHSELPMNSIITYKYINTNFEDLRIVSDMPDITTSFGVAKKFSANYVVPNMVPYLEVYSHAVSKSRLEYYIVLNQNATLISSYIHDANPVPFSWSLSVSFSGLGKTINHTTFSKEYKSTILTLFR